MLLLCRNCKEQRFGKAVMPRGEIETCLVKELKSAGPGTRRIITERKRKDLGKRLRNDFVDGIIRISENRETVLTDYHCVTRRRYAYAGNDQDYF